MFSYIHNFNYISSIDIICGIYVRDVLGTPSSLNAIFAETVTAFYSKTLFSYTTNRD